MSVDPWLALRSSGRSEPTVTLRTTHAPVAQCGPGGAFMSGPASPGASQTQHARTRHPSHRMGAAPPAGEVSTATQRVHRARSSSRTRRRCAVAGCPDAQPHGPGLVRPPACGVFRSVCWKPGCAPHRRNNSSTAQRFPTAQSLSAFGLQRDGSPSSLERATHKFRVYGYIWDNVICK